MRSIADGVRGSLRGDRPLIAARDCVHATFSHKGRRKVAVHSPGRDDDRVLFRRHHVLAKAEPRHPA